MKLYKHIKNTDVAVEVLRFIHIPGKDYVKIKVRWWKISGKPYCMNIVQHMQTTEGSNLKQRRKYPIKKWEEEWEQINV